MNRSLRRAQASGKRRNDNENQPVAGDFRLVSASQLLNQKNYAEAEAIYREILASDPSNADAILGLANVACCVGQTQVGIELFQATIKMYPNHVGALLGLASLYMVNNQYAESEELLRKAVAAGGETPEVILVQAAICNNTGQFEKTIELVQRGLKINPNKVELLVLAATAQSELNRDVDAKKNLLAANAIMPDNPEILYQLASLYLREGNVKDALKCCGGILDLPPEQVGAGVLSELGVLYQSQEELGAAITCCERAAMLAPDNNEVLSKLAGVYFASGRKHDALSLMLPIIEREPDNMSYWFNLGRVYQGLCAMADAEAAYRRSIEIEPTASGYNNLALILNASLRYEEAISLFEEGARLFPDNGVLCNNIANYYKDVGDIANALKWYRMAFERDRTQKVAHSNLIFTMHFDPKVSPEEIYRETLAWAANYAEHLPRFSHDAHDADQNRRLRIGYVSADLREHPVVHFLEPIFSHHNKEEVEIYSYANLEHEDPTTNRFKYYSDHWRNIFYLNDEQVAQQIYDDKIDILFDLSGHTAGNRLPAFAQKPAPIQMTWIGYFNTTGLTAMDYIVTDRYYVPEEEEKLYSEKPLILRKASCFQTYNFSIPVVDAPCLRKGYVTFGCFSQLSKYSPELLQMWVKILQAVPNSRLYLKNNSFGDESCRNDYIKRFVDMGIDESRLRFAGASLLEYYLKEYGEVDMMLDTFPYNAGTTTMDSLWMGVPVIALHGDRMLSRIGESFLKLVGFPEFVASNLEDYVAKAVHFAGQPDYLNQVRAKIRPAFEASIAANPKLYVAEFEQAIRQAWKKWCVSK
jgi:protein O-GlcNAc transferase